VTLCVQSLVPWTDPSISESGRLIPIDFGHAFGSATELLPVPELVPFRMTPQLQGFFEPLGVDCLLKHLMVDIMRGDCTGSCIRVFL
jgi:phosphatidylinositol kinase/protein kinase (PI-3  family)